MPITYSSLADLLGINRPRTPLSYLSRTNAVGLDYLNSNEGANSLYESYIDSIAATNPALARLLRRNTKRIEDQYGAAAAENTALSRVGFLESYDPGNLRKTLTPYERGENPGAYQGRYKFTRA